MSDTLSRLTPIFREVFEQPTLTVSRESTASTVDGWDSLAHVSLIAAVEEAMGLHFALSELEDMQCVGDMVDLIDRKLQSR